jgi:hypothetical protein
MENLQKYTKLRCCINSQYGILIGASIALLLLSSRAYSQQRDYDKIWVQGQDVTYTSMFSGAAPPVNLVVAVANRLYFTYGNSNICDSAGNLLLICDGYNLYDKDLNLLEDGDTLVPNRIYARYGSSPATQSSIILPFDNGIYRVITPTASDSEMINYWEQPQKGRALFDLLLYHEVDMSANSGAGKVTKRMIPLLENVQLSKTQMMACRHGNGKDWWLLKQASDTNMIYKFLFTQDRIYGPYVQGFAEPHFSKWDICGQAMFSKDGSKYATTIQGFKKIFLADFDRCSGVLSNPKVIDVPGQHTHNPFDTAQRDSSTCGLSFSPNSRFLYVNSFYGVQQIDLLDTNPATAWTTLSGPDTTWNWFQQYSNIYPGPDAKLYIGNWNGGCGQMSVINNPDAKGIAAGFCSKCLRFPGFVFQGDTYFAGVATPPCMPNYHLGPTNPLCNFTSVEASEQDKEFVLYPNPADDLIHIKSAVDGIIQILDYTGRMVASQKVSRNTRATVATSHFTPGIYLYRLTTGEQQVSTGKIIIAR